MFRNFSLKEQHMTHDGTSWRDGRDRQPGERIMPVALSVMVLAMMLAVVGSGSASAVGAKDFVLGPTRLAASTTGTSPLSVPITVTRGKSFTAALTFRIVNPFADVTASQTAVTPNGFTLVMVASPDAKTQTKVVQVIASGGGRKHTLKVRATFTAQSGPTTLAPTPLPTSPVATTLVASTPSSTSPAVTVVSPTTVSPVAPPSTVAVPITTAGDFTVESEYPWSELFPNEPAELSVIVDPLKGYTGTPKLDVVGLPAGITSAVIEDRGIVAQGKRARRYLLRLTPTPGVPLGVYPIKVRGTDGSLVRTGDLTLRVKTPVPMTIRAEFRVPQVVPGNTELLDIKLEGAAIEYFYVSHYTNSPLGFSFNRGPGFLLEKSTSLVGSFPATTPPGDYEVGMRVVELTHLTTSELKAQIRVSGNPRLSSNVSAVTIPVGGTAEFIVTNFPVNGISQLTYQVNAIDVPLSTADYSSIDANTIKVSIGTRLPVGGTGTPPGIYAVRVTASGPSGSTTLSLVLTVK
jgi:hypothetical protein